MTVKSRRYLGKDLLIMKPDYGKIIIGGFIFLAVFTVISMIVSVPFDYYDTFVIEEK